MAQVRVRAIANVMGLRRGDEGDVETGTAHIDAMINAGYLQVIEYLPDPIPTVEAFPTIAAIQYAHKGSFEDAEVREPTGWVDPPPTVVETALGTFVDPPPSKIEPGSTIEEEVKPRGKANSSKNRPRPSRSRSAAARRSTGDTGDGQDARSSLGDGTSGHGEPQGSAPDEQAGGEA